MSTPNFSFVKEGKLIATPLAPLIEDITALPFPDREVYYELSEKIRGYTVRSFLASRGCPFSCTYCFNHSMDALYGGCFRKTRVRSPENLAEEIQTVRGQYPTEFLAFRESVFPLSREWLERFGALMERQGVVPFYCHLRLDTLDAERVALLKRAGCHSVNVGIESGRHHIRQGLLGRDMSDETIIRGCVLLREAGIKVLANNMLGLPGTTFEDDWATLLLNQSARPDYSLAMLYQPYPGTELGRRAQAEGWFDGEVDNLEFSYYDASHLRFPNPLEQRRVENLQRLFGAAAKLPLLNPLTDCLTRLPKNAVFDTIFKTLYLVYHQSEIFPHRIGARGWLEHIRGLME